MKPRVATLSLAAPIVVPLEGVRMGWGTGLAFAPPSSLYFSWIEGVGAYRVGRWDLARGTLEQTRSIGLLRDALVESRKKRVHVLTEHGLLELELRGLGGLRKLRKGLPKEPVRLREVGRAGLAVVGGFRSRSSYLVSLDDYAIVSRLAAPVPEAIVPRRNGFVFVSDGEGILFSFTGQLMRRFPLPASSSACTLGDGRVVLATDSVDGTELVSLSLTGTATSSAPIAHVPDDIVEFLGIDSSGCLVARTSVASEAGFAWIDPKTGKVRGRLESDERRRFCLAGSMVVGTPVAAPTEPFAFYTLSAKSKPFEELGEPKPEPVKAAFLPTSRVSAEGVPVVVRHRFDRSHPDRWRITRSAPTRFEHCVFEHQSIEAPIAFHDLTFVRCTFVMCYVLEQAARATFTDIVFDGCSIKGKPCFLRGLDLRRIVFRGKTRGTLVLQQFPSALLGRGGDANDWALDISQGEFSGLELRGLPSRLVRRNPELHGVVRRDRLADERWKKLSLGVARVVLEDIAEGEAEDGLLLVNTLDRKWRERAADLAKLRAEGIAEPL